MTNQKVTIEIEDFEDKKSANGKRYSRFKTSQGWMSAFEADIIEELKKAEKEKMPVIVEIAIDEEKGFKNIRKFLGISNVAPTSETTESKEVVWKKPVVVKDTTTMYVSYSKDVFLALLEIEMAKEETKRLDYGTLMSVACALVKTAKLSFEND